MFEAYEGDNWDIYSVNADGANLMQVTNAPGDEISPVWSPDGTQVAFAAGEAADRDIRNVGTFEIYVVNADGTGQTRLNQRGVHLGGLGMATTPGLDGPD